MPEARILGGEEIDQENVMNLALWLPTLALLGLRLRYWIIIIVVILVIIGLAYYVMRRPTT